MEESKDHLKFLRIIAFYIVNEPLLRIQSVCNACLGTNG
jgi:hypothetical protein